VPRPGIARGAYPERCEGSSDRLDRALHAARGWWLRGPREAELAAFAAEVEVEGRVLSGLGEAALRSRREELRARLLADGPSRRVLPRGFALVRETASRTLGTPHYQVQLMAGFAMARGMLVEMETGEGKTLAATLPAATAALAGVPVHVISANDYLVERDAEALRPLYEALGLSVAAVTEKERDERARRSAYRCDVVYATAKQVAFDYLRDGLVRGGRPGRLSGAVERARGARQGAERLLLRGLCFAIVDEADSVLVDEARTPLVLSGAGRATDGQRTIRRALRIASALEEGADFRLDPRAGSVDLLEPGRERVERLASPLGGVFGGPRRREEWVLRALRTLHLLARDRDYIVREGRVRIVDQPTGRVAPDRAWEMGIQQLVEAKEGCELSVERETLARIGYRQFFRRYLRLAGATGTAREVARELWSVYGLRTVRVPTRRPVRRACLGTRVFATRGDGWQAVVDRARAARAEGLPLLVGTWSVLASEELAGLLEREGLPHRVLNARQDADEARVVAEAGRAGRITVATNMAGRGTDVRLAAGVAERGGLHVIAMQRAESRRIERQLFGRCARQGDPGRCESIVSLEDELVVRHQPAWLRRVAARRLAGGGRLGRWLALALTKLSQHAEERLAARARRRLVDLEEYRAELLAFAGPGE
jgi:preprotein translocase subunit SecA